VEARVVGCLVEKQRTVPDTYPLTLNALVSACNQTSNRDPILHLADGDVVRAIDSLKARGMARIVHPATGSRVTKYRHVLDEALGLDDGPLSVVTVLLLRGPQTVAELRTRTERLHPFADLDAVEAALESLGELVERLDRRPGEREPRWTLLLAPSGHPDVRLPPSKPRSPSCGRWSTACTRCWTRSPTAASRGRPAGPSARGGGGRRGWRSAPR
jgi:uncharacterized protein YceH (UPF0502 family)